MKLSWSKLAAAAATVVALGVAGTALAQKVTLDVLYAQPGFAKYHEPIAQAFMKAHPDVEIKFRAPAKDYDEGHQAMMRAAVTNQLPDIYFPGFHLLGELSATLEKRGQIVDLGPKLAAEPAAWRTENYTDTVIKLGQAHGKQYGLAVNASLPIMYFNADLVKKAGGDPAKMPDTFDGVIALAAKIAATSPGTAGMSYDTHVWPDTWLFQAIIDQAGGRMLDDSGTKIAFDNAVGRKAMTDLRRFVTDGKMPMLDFEASRQQFLAGQTGLFFDTPARMRLITDGVGNRFTLGTAVFPIDDKAKGGIPTGGCAIIITTKDAAKQKAAWDYAKFITGPEAQKIIVEITGYLPLNKRASGPEFLGPFYDKNPNFRTVSLQVDRALPWQGYPGDTVRIWRMQRDIINEVMRGQIAPDAGLQKMVSETRTMMK
ncbi:MAG TPA: ABC transporter substrate-binding protein [Casimicrobiaceae bacterium]|nr:ABC transporter substrate-binding protein [Casimicrobiaceae bacterium]